MIFKDNLIDTNVQWIGEIPKHWDLGRVKNLTYVKARIGWQGMRSDEFVDNTDWYCVTGTDFKNGVIDWSNCYCIEQWRYNQDRKIQLKLNDILITKDGTIGKIALINELPKKATLNSGVFVTRPYFDRYQTKYFFWLLNSNVFTEFIDYFKNGSTILHLYQNVFVRFVFPIPPLKEQTQIANYLDAKTTTIDKKIKLLKQKIKHYKAYRKILINETVTKGLNDDISDWVKFRLKDLGYLYSGLSGKSGDDFNQDDNPNNKGFIPFTNIANNTYLDKKQLGTVVIEDNEKQNQVKKNDIFFLMSSEGYEDIGKSAVLIEDLKETYLNSFCKGYRLTNKNCDASFINYLLLSDIYRQQMLVEGKGFTRINLKMEKVNNFSILIPPTIEEQQQIADFLDAKTTTIDNIVNNIETQITTLKELRKTLINEVVTGKVKVTA